MRWFIGFIVGILGLALAAWIAADRADARWKPGYAAFSPKVQRWFKEQHNAQGQWCCDESDGHPFFGGYTINKDGSVTLDLASGKRTLPAHMVLTGPNPTGHAVWWYLEAGNSHTDFCFAPGTLT